MTYIYLIAMLWLLAMTHKSKLFCGIMFLLHMLVFLFIFATGRV